LTVEIFNPETAGTSFPRLCGNAQAVFPSHEKSGAGGFGYALILSKCSSFEPQGARRRRIISVCSDVSAKKLVDQCSSYWPRFGKQEPGIFWARM